MPAATVRSARRHRLVFHAVFLLVAFGPAVGAAALTDGRGEDGPPALLLTVVGLPLCAAYYEWGIRRGWRCPQCGKRLPPQDTPGPEGIGYLSCVACGVVWDTGMPHEPPRESGCGDG